MFHQSEVGCSITRCLREKKVRRGGGGGGGGGGEGGGADRIRGGIKNKVLRGEVKSGCGDFTPVATYPLADCRVPWCCLAAFTPSCQKWLRVDFLAVAKTGWKQS